MPALSTNTYRAAVEALERHRVASAAAEEVNISTSTAFKIARQNGIRLLTRSQRMALSRLEPDFLVRQQSPLGRSPAIRSQRQRYRSKLPPDVLLKTLRSLRRYNNARRAALEAGINPSTAWYIAKQFGIELMPLSQRTTLRWQDPEFRHKRAESIRRRTEKRKDALNAPRDAASIAKIAQSHQPLPKRSAHPNSPPQPRKLYSHHRPLA